MKKGFKQLIAEAEAVIETLTVAEALAQYESDEILIVDVRDQQERDSEGFIPNSVHVPRGMLEFMADADGPFYHEGLGTDKKLMLHCASGGRSALSAFTLHNMGYEAVGHIAGGFTAWKEANGDVEKSAD